MEQHATVDGRVIRYLDHGQGEPLLLLHAFPLSAELWRPQVGALPPGWRLIAPDFRGFGGSSRTVHGVDAPAHSLDDHARDALALLDHLDIATAVVGGLSMGGYATFALWRLQPGRARALVLADTRAEADTDEGRRNREAMLAGLAASGPTFVADTLIPRVLSPATHRTQPGIVRFVRGLIEGADPASIADAIRCLMTRPDSTPLLADIQVPVHLIVGRDDALTPVAAHEQMQSALPNASLTIIEDAGHLSNLEQPDVFNRSLARFLQSL